MSAPRAIIMIVIIVILLCAAAVYGAATAGIAYNFRVGGGVPDDIKFDPEQRKRARELLAQNISKLIPNSDGTLQQPETRATAALKARTFARVEVAKADEEYERLQQHNPEQAKQQRIMLLCSLCGDYHRNGHIGAVAEEEIVGLPPEAPDAPPLLFGGEVAKLSAERKQLIAKMLEAQATNAAIGITVAPTPAMMNQRAKVAAREKVQILEKEAEKIEDPVLRRSMEISGSCTICAEYHKTGHNGAIGPVDVDSPGEVPDAPPLDMLSMPFPTVAPSPVPTAASSPVPTAASSPMSTLAVSSPALTLPFAPPPAALPSAFLSVARPIPLTASLPAAPPIPLTASPPAALPTPLNASLPAAPPPVFLPTVPPSTASLSVVPPVSMSSGIPLLESERLIQAPKNPVDTLRTSYVPGSYDPVVVVADSVKGLDTLSGKAAELYGIVLDKKGDLLPLIKSVATILHADVANTNRSPLDMSTGATGWLYKYNPVAGYWHSVDYVRPALYAA